MSLGMNDIDTYPPRGQVVPLLTDQRRRILDVIRGFYAEHGSTPTIREIGAETGRSASSVQYQLGQLQRMGWISRHPTLARSLVVLDPATGRP
jgi:SOS-response transcriptional repressor LexA